MSRLTAMGDRSELTSRREVMRIGSAAGIGLTLAGLLGAQTARPKARSLILIAMEGGPSHIDLWDMKPDAPAEIRGEFEPIATSVPGLVFCEHLPQLARGAHRMAVIRSAHHEIGDHNAGHYQAVSGRDPRVGGKLIVAPSPDNFPSIPAVISKLQPSARNLPDSVQAPDWMSNNGALLPGQSAGFLGARFDPLIAGDPSLAPYQVPGLAIRGIDIDRAQERWNLKERLDRSLDHAPAFALDRHHARALELIASPQARRAFDIESEPLAIRERYGFDPTHPRDKEARQFGGIPHFGQCLLLARRLIEAGVRVVTVCSGARFDQTWDTHRQNFGLLKQSILPWFDRGLAALLEDLESRGLLDETLVVAMGEFGRTPRVGQITSDAGADRAGRDHWPHCYSLLMAGGGVPGGLIHGASDRNGAYPARDAVTPADIAATIYALLGVPLEATLEHPREHRRVPVSTGTPIESLVGG